MSFFNVWESHCGSIIYSSHKKFLHNQPMPAFLRYAWCTMSELLIYFPHMLHDKKRCEWATNSLNIAYHDMEWGVPVHDDTKLFEFLILEGAQAGLSWSTILKKRENYRKAFDSFDAKKITQYDSKKVAFLLA